VRAAVLLAAGVAAACSAAPASAATLGGLHDARYCEIIALKGAPPDATAVVWNTIGLNKCPAAWWNAFDASALAKELGAGVVLLNGPRHFLMDSVTVPRRGRVRSFHGQKLRRVAAIPIHTAAELAQVPYTDRVVKRDNTWRWQRGRRVYELVAPGGDVYVMQAYAQIKDPHQTIGKLRSLGHRLALPPGWRYRSRVLRKPLAVGANGQATIVQDELQNTYQLASTTRRPGPRKRHKLSIDGKTKEVGTSAAGINDRGTVTGTPFGKGTVDIVVSLANGKATGTFRLLYPKGSVIGTVDMPFKITGGEIDFRGTAKLTGGTGAYRGITSGTLAAHDHNTLDGQNGVVTLTGSAKY
jgi:hypothetical protein